MPTLKFLWRKIYISGEIDISPALLWFDSEKHDTVVQMTLVL